MTLKQMLRALEARIIRRALRRHGGNQTRTAHWLGISRRTLIYRMDKLKISVSITDPAALRGQRMYERRGT